MTTIGRSEPSRLERAATGALGAPRAPRAPRATCACAVALAAALLLGHALAQAPQADAGPDLAVEASLTAFVEVDGSHSTGGAGETLRFDWVLLSKPAASEARLVDDDAPVTRFTPDRVGDYELLLIVADAGGQAEDRVTVTASCPDPLRLGGDVREPLVLAPASLDCVDVVVTDHLRLRAATTIEAGTWIEVEAGRRLAVIDEGALRAAGTPERPIRIVGSAAEPGHWASLAIGTADPRNVLRHVTLAHGGTASANSNHVATTLFVPSSGRVRLQDVRVEASSGHGMVADRLADLTGFARNAFVGNAEAPLVLHPRLVGVVDAASRFADPDPDSAQPAFVLLTRGDVEFDVQWVPLDVPLRVEHPVQVVDGARLTLTPGTTVEFASRSGLLVACGSNAGRALHVAGSADAPVVLRGVESGPGAWGGLHFCGDDPDNVVRHARIEGAGEARLVSGRAEAAITVAAEGRLELRDSVVIDALTHGLHAHATATIVPDAPGSAASGNRFEGQAGAAVVWR